MCQGPPGTPSPSASTSLTTPASASPRTTSAVQNPNGCHFENCFMLSNVDDISTLHAQLSSLQEKEDQLMAMLRTEESDLHKQIREKQDSLKNLEALVAKQRHPVPPQNHSALPVSNPANHNLGSNAPDPTIPAFLSATSSSCGLRSVFSNQAPRTSELFLRPTTSIAAASCGKPLRIVDFVCRLLPNEDEQLLSSDTSTNTKLYLAIGHKKPKLTSVSIDQYAAASIRIFYELLCSNRLPSLSDVQDYLSYAIKVFEMSRKYTWESVLRYDDEYRVLQHMYGFPWSYDQNHLHEVILMPRWVDSKHALGPSSKTSPNPSFGTHTSAGLEICRNFNRQKGCVKAVTGCKFAHVCNCLVGLQVCGKSHPGHAQNTSA